jgi:hypothetical protein
MLGADLGGIIMRASRAFAASIVSAICLAVPGHAQQVSVVTYLCNIEGAPAQLTAQVQAVNTAGVFMDGAGMFAGSIPTGEVTYYYQGMVVSATSRYSFQGENQFADFVDLNSNERFRVQFIVQGPQLLMIVNPFGPGPVQYLCQLQGQQR